MHELLDNLAEINYSHSEEQVRNKIQFPVVLALNPILIHHW